MLTSSDLSGVMAMMPAFTTDDGASIDATETVDVDRLAAGLNRMIGDGAGVISTCGSFGECHTLLWEEFETLSRATVEVVNRRVPLFLGCTSPNPREVVRKMKLVRELGADGVLLAPFPASTIPPSGWIDDCHLSAEGCRGKAAYLEPFVRGLLERPAASGDR